MLKPLIHIKTRLTLILPMLAASAPLFVSCSQDTRTGNVTICTVANCTSSLNTEGKKTTPKATPAPTPSPTPKPVPPLDPKSAMLMLRENCMGCHGVGKDKRSFWPMPSEFELPLEAEAAAANLDLVKTDTFEKILNDTNKLEKLINKMEADQFSVQVFQSIENNLVGADNSMPKKMRPAMEDKVKKRFIALLDQLIAAKDGPTALSSNIGATSTAMVMSLKEARSWCAGCHTPGGSGSSVWSQANGEADQWKAFAALAKDSVTAGRMPIAKPRSGADRDKWLGLLGWFNLRMPLVVAEARDKYHGQALNLGLPVSYDYKCNSIVSSRQFLNRLTTDALGRPPSPAEVQLLSSPDTTASLDTRKQLVSRLTNEWKTEFVNYGLKMFAEKVSGAQKIRNSLVITDPQMREDVAREFYQLVKSETLANKSYKDILTSKKVFVTAKTAPFYNQNCIDAAKNIPSGQTHVECQMDANGSPRSNFFTTLGFLSSKPSSMFLENNNYGRVAAMNEVMRGEPLLANTQGEQGESIDALPSCLVTSDWRVVAKDKSYAPRGTASVPASGNFCQGCHIRRNLGSGSIAFRPYGPMGELITTSVIDALIKQTDATKLSVQESILRNQIQDSLTDQWGVMPPGSDFAPLGLSHFTNFLYIGTLPGQERGCIVDPMLQEPKTVTKVQDLVDYALSDQLLLARGLSRIVPRALSNLNATNTEVIKAVTGAWTASDGKLLPIFQAYFATDTYACSSAGGQ